MGQWQHLGVSSDMEHIRGIIGVEFRRLRNIHHIELYRTQEGVWAHWKQYVTTEAWSKPLLLMHDDQVVLLSRLKPPDIPHAFGATLDSPTSSNSWSVCCLHRGGLNSLIWFGMASGGGNKSWLLQWCVHR